MKAKPFSRARAAGFTLVEIMIGLLIGLIGIVVIMETYAVSEGYRRTTTSGTDAQVNGAIAMYLMQRELRIAGYNLQPYLVAQCTSFILWEENLGKSRWVRFVPVEINPAGFNVGDVNTDVILIAYGNSDTSVAGVNVGVAAAPLDHTFTIKANPTSYRTGDLVFTVQPPTSGTDPICVAHEATNVPQLPGNCGQSQPPAGTGYTIEHKYRQYPNYGMGCQLYQANHNASGQMKDPSGVVIPDVSISNSQIYSMGPNPSAKIYAIRNGNLTVCDTFQKMCTTGADYDVLVNDIVSMRAILGGDLVGGPGTGNGLLGDGSVDQWSRNAYATPTDVRRTVAIAIELTARSGLREKSSTGSADPTQCDATVNTNLPDKAQTLDWYDSYIPMASGSLAGAKIDLSQTDPNGQWKCYRYKLFQSVVPLRNLLWTPG